MKGLCEEYCPRDEVKMRVKQKLLHFYEYKDPKKKEVGLLVKEFARSAAGVKMPNPHSLRTLRSLQDTERHLITKILIDKRKPYHIAYDFIFDRLRAIRQEIVIQDFNHYETIALLEPIIMFLAYSRYQLCEDIKNFDSHICEQHLLECIKRVLICYDLTDCQHMSSMQLKRRAFIEALYQIFNLGTIEPLHRGVTMPKEIKEDIVYQKSFTIAMNYYRGNFWRTLNKIKTLPHILCAISIVKLQIIRRKLLSIFAHGYNHKKFTVPIDFVAKIALMESSELISDCIYYNFQISKDKKAIIFQKSDIKTDQPIQQIRKEKFIEEKLKEINLPLVIMLSEF